MAAAFASIASTATSAITQEAEPMTLINRWLALQVKARAEKAVARQLSAKGYEEFVPTYRKRRTASGRVSGAELPLIPGYVFCRFSLQGHAHIVTTPGVIRVVSAGTTWLPVADDEIEALQRVAASPVAVEPWAGVQIGQPVEVAAGPLAGVRGALLRIGTGRRLIITVQILQRSVAVEIDQDALLPVAAAPRQLAIA
jgi:transcriptional antiterminator NusG